MMRFIFIAILVLSIALLFLLGSVNERNTEKPVFLTTDEIVNAHQTKINITVHSLYKPDSFQLTMLTKNYSAVWAHLNHLFETNNVEAGKEYYTENWFKQINRHYNGPLTTLTTRTDEQHHLHIQNWASDGLVCTAIDSNVILKYHYPNGTTKKTNANLAVVLLLQGDNWRIDALRVISETALVTH